jgi:hypothetical protein
MLTLDASFKERQVGRTFSSRQATMFRLWL